MKNKKILSVTILAFLMSFNVSCNGSNDETSNISSQSISIADSDVQLNEWNRVILGDYMLMFSSKDEPDKDITSGTPVVFDFNSMDTTILCNRPNCSHSDSKCIAYTLAESHQLPVIWGNCLYYFSESCDAVERSGKRVLDLNASVIKYSMDDMTRSTVGTIDDHNISSSSYAGSCLIGSEYYFITNDGDPEYDEAGNVISSGNGGRANLFSIDLGSEKIVDHGEIFDYEKCQKDVPFDSVHPYIIGTEGSNIYIRIDFQKDPVTKPQVFVFDTVNKSFLKNDDVFAKQVKDGYMLYYSSNGSTQSINTRDKNTEKKIYVKELATGKVIEGPIVKSPTMSLGNGKVWYDNCCFDIASGKTAVIPDTSENDIVWYHTLYKDDYIIDIYGENGKQTVKIPVNEINSLFE